jgi:alkane 1-monooxygenase
MKDFKYLIAYIVPFSAILALYAGGIWSFSGFYLAFVIIPVLEFFMPGTTENHGTEAEDTREKRFVFDFLLYTNLPLLFFIIFYFLQIVTYSDLAMYELVGMTLTVGIICGAMGINVAHELGHRETWYEQAMSKVLLLSCHYMHFFIEHNRGHHKNVSTDEDPASARFGENVYAFFVRSVVGSYCDAWKLENSRLAKEGKAAFSIYNEMIWYQVIQALYIIGIGLWFGKVAMLATIVAGIIGFLLLELINYIEHYGLRRKKLESGRYEKVMPHHSWNSNHDLGRIVLYELTRHSDHHYKATRKYQILRHFDESPQLPLGYPGSMLLALVPPLWFGLMDKEVEKYNKTFHNEAFTV